MGKIIEQWEWSRLNFIERANVVTFIASTFAVHAYTKISNQVFLSFCVLSSGSFLVLVIPRLIGK